MASEEHLALSTYIKNVHKKLREDSERIGYEHAWNNHCGDQKTLKKYAVAMKELACKHWQENQEKVNSKATCRINWIHKNSYAYFKEGGIIFQRNKEQQIEKKMNWKVVPSTNLDTKIKYKLLDVGSCYNPFKKYDLFSVLAIDIAPENEEVVCCDFLNLIITENMNNGHEYNNSKISQVKECSFDIIVFSLLLEYFPEPHQRLLCCKNAYKILKPEGILFIITPDAKHVGANAKYMKSWQYILATLGFSRIKYEKLHYLHCMIFRKSLNPAVPIRWASLNQNRDLFQHFYIPQDFSKNRI